MATNFRMNVVDWTALAVLVVGALNWGLVGVAHFVDAAANWNLVNILFDGTPAAEFGIYVLVGLAGLYGIYLAVRLSGARDVSPDHEMETPRGAAK